MAGKALVDTNVLVYSVDARDVAKLQAARDVLQNLRSACLVVLSQQVLSEFARVVTERIPAPLTAKEAVTEVREYARVVPILPVTPDIIADALGIAERSGRSFLDAQLIATARANGIGVIVSEDFEDGASCEGVRFANPFAPDFDAGALPL